MPSQPYGSVNLDLVVRKAVGFHKYTNETRGYIKPNTVAGKTLCTWINSDTRNQLTGKKLRLVWDCCVKNHIYINAKRENVSALNHHAFIN